MIDWQHVDELRGDLGDSFGDIVKVFLEEVDGGIARLTDTADAKAAEQTLHFLKGAAMNLGFSDFGALCSKGEIDARAGQVDPAHLAAVRQCYAESREAFLAGLARRAA